MNIGRVIRGAGVAAAVGLASGLAPAVQVAQAWAPAASATIHPGVQLFTQGSQCTANFVYTSGSNVYIGQAAHCSGTGGNTATNGCTSPSLPTGTQVQITGAAHPGVMVYNSWLTMQSLGGTDPTVCQYNDLALVQVDPADVASVNPSVPFYGGPTGLHSGGTNVGETVLSYGNSELRLGLTQLSPKKGVSIGDAGAGWSHQVYTVTPGIPGDSGSGFMDAAGRALGILSTVAVLPVPLSNGVGDLNLELQYAAAHGWGVTLATGTQPFTNPLLPLG